MPRLKGIDMVRGMVLVSMLLYHFCWDLVYLHGVDFPWYESSAVYVWQQSICWVFILLSGFCWSMGKHPLKRGIIVFLAGAVISLVTLLFLPEERVIFGVLTFLGCSMLITIPLERLLKKIPPIAGLLGSVVLFVLLRNINTGFLGFGDWNICKLPTRLYHGYFMTFLGFPENSFFSTDYVSLFPWYFLFLTGYYTYCMLSKGLWLTKLFENGIPPFTFLGRHSLLIYMLHQPIMYGILWVCFSL